MEPVATAESYSFLRRLFEQKAPLRTFYTREELTEMVTSGKLTVVKEIVEDYTNWVRTDSEETAEGVKTLYTNGILHFMIHDGYLVIIAVKEPRHIIAL